jgi:hypothetical protein
MMQIMMMIMMIFMRRRMVVMSDDDDGAPTLNRISLVIASVNDVILQLYSGSINLSLITQTMLTTVGFMVVSVLLVRCVHLRRQQERLQQEVSNLLYEYIPMDGFDMDAVNLSSHDKHTSLLEARHV